MKIYIKSAVIDPSEESDDVRYTIVRNKNTRPETLRELAKDESLSIRFGVARHKNTSQDVLDELAYDTSENIQEAVAANQNTSAETLRHLYFENRDNPSTRIAAYVIKNPNVPTDLLSDAVWNAPHLRAAVAVNDVTPLDLLEVLATSSDYMVRYWVPSNPNVSVELLEQLSHDRESQVRENALEYLEKLGK